MGRGMSCIPLLNCEADEDGDASPPEPVAIPPIVQGIAVYADPRPLKFASELLQWAALDTLQI